MEKHKYTGKDIKEAKNNACIDLQETEENLIIKELSSTKKGLFKQSKVEIEVIEKREIVPFIKNKIYELLKDIGFNTNIEVRNTKDVPKFTIYSDNDSLLIGKNGKNLQSLSLVISQIVKKEIGESFKFLIDVNEYKEKREKKLEHLAKKIAREVKESKVEVKLDSMNSYERRIIHEALKNNKYVFTESTGEEPNRCVVVKPKED